MSNGTDEDLSYPDRFAGMHGHTTFSVFDGLGYPDEHIDFILSNGGDAWSLTDHGNGNGLAHARKHAQKVTKAGRRFRQIYGVEFYFVPDLRRWRIDYEDAKVVQQKAKDDKKKLAEEQVVQADDAEEAGHVVENEEETKQVSSDKPEWKRRYHLVVTARSRKGLENINRLVKRSFTEGYYKFPRIDFAMLQEHCEDIFVSSACLGGILSQRILNCHVRDRGIDEIQRQLSDVTGRFVEILGRENFALELQFNKLPAQHIVNEHLLEHHRRTGIQLISTCDSHYPTPEKWEARELYKQLGWMRNEGEIRQLPERQDLKCELYPKNHNQMWDEFLSHRGDYDFYKGQAHLIRDSITRTHDLVWNHFQDCWIDTRVKLPKIDTSVKSEIEQLSELAYSGLKQLGLDTDQRYIDRLELELSDIGYMGFTSYFLVMDRIFKQAAQRTLFGAARGCFISDTLVKCKDNISIPISQIVKSQEVIDAYGQIQCVKSVLRYEIDEEILELTFEDGRVIECTADHEFLTTDGRWVRAADLTEQDDVKEIS